MVEYEDNSYSLNIVILFKSLFVIPVFGCFLYNKMYSYGQPICGSSFEHILLTEHVPKKLTFIFSALCFVNKMN